MLKLKPPTTLRAAAETNPLLLRLDELGAAHDPPMSREAICKAAGISRDVLRQLEKRGPKASIRADTLSLLAQALGVSPEDLHAAAPRRAARSAPGSPSGDRLPIRGAVAGSVLGSFFLSKAPTGQVARPPGLFDVPDAYAVYVHNDSMAPMHEQADLRFVNPHKPPRKGDSVIMRLKNGEAFIKVYEGRSGDWIVCRQINPPAEVKYALSQVEAIHHVMTTAELFNK